MDMEACLSLSCICPSMIILAANALARLCGYGSLSEPKLHTSFYVYSSSQCAGETVWIIEGFLSLSCSHKQ